MKKVLYTGSILIGTSLMFWAILSPFMISSLQTDAAMSQVKTDENAVLERSFLRMNPETIKNTSLVVGAGLIVLPIYFITRKKSS